MEHRSNDVHILTVPRATTALGLDQPGILDPLFSQTKLKHLDPLHEVLVDVLL